MKHIVPGTLHCFSTNIFDTLAKCIFAFGDAPVIWPVVLRVYDRGYGLLVLFLLCYTLIQRPGFPVIRVYTYVRRVTSANRDKWIRSGDIPVFRFPYHEFSSAPTLVSKSQSAQWRIVRRKRKIRATPLLVVYITKMKLCGFVIKHENFTQY